MKEFIMLSISFFLLNIMLVLSQMNEEQIRHNKVIESRYSKIDSLNTNLEILINDTTEVTDESVKR